MDSARIASLLAPFLAPDALTDRQLDQVSTYLGLLLKWNARINLTSVRQPEDIITRHFGESFFTARQLCHPERSPARSSGPGAAEEPLPSAVVIPSAARPRAAGSAESRDLGSAGLIDVGSGAGFPGLPIKIYAPELPVTLVESNQKKATFLRETIRALTLTYIDVFAGRAEDFPGAAAIVTLRAVEKPELALPATARLVSPGGRLVLLLGASHAPDLQGLLPGFSWASPVTLPGSSHRIVVIGRKSDQESK
jgi:16S rRNA (guanine527-N7)-methyltransferase